MVFGNGEIAIATINATAAVRSGIPGDNIVRDGVCAPIPAHDSTAIIIG